VANVGWRCDCGRSWAPHVDSCRACDPETASKPKAPCPTVATLWEAYALVAPTLLVATTWRVWRTYRNTFGRLKLTLDDGTESTIADLPADKVTPRVAEIYRMAREKEPNNQGGTVSPITVNSELGALQAVLSYSANIAKTLPANPLDGWRRVDEAPYARQTYLTPEQARKFIGAGVPLFQDICTVAYRCAGMRNSEARLLRKSEVDFARRVINLPSSRNKNAKPRVVPFPSDVEAILRRHCDGSLGPYVFVRPKDPDRVKPVPQSTFQRWLDQARERSGVTGFDGETVVVHTLRHCAVTDLLQAKHDPTAVMAAAAMSPRTLMRYSKFGPTQQDAMREHMEAQLQQAPERVGPRRAQNVRPGRSVRR
jgi:integrase